MLDAQSKPCDVLAVLAVLAVELELEAPRAVAVVLLLFCYCCILSVKMFLPVGISVHRVRAWCAGSLEEGVWSPGTGVTDDCRLPLGCWEP